MQCYPAGNQGPTAPMLAHSTDSDLKDNAERIIYLQFYLKIYCTWHELYADHRCRSLSLTRMVGAVEFSRHAAGVDSRQALWLPDSLAPSLSVHNSVPKVESLGYTIGPRQWKTDKIERTKNY